MIGHTTNSNTPSSKEALRQLLQFLLIIAIGFTAMIIISSLIQPFYSNAFNDKNEIINPSLLRALLSLQFGLLMFAPVIAYLSFWAPQADKLVFNHHPIRINYGLAALAFIVALPFVDFLATINQSLVFPQWFPGIDSWVRETEASTNKMIVLMLSTNNWPTIVLNTCIIAVMPAICEEFVFRGVIQHKITQWGGSALWAIIITSVIFSAFHFQFLTFLPRLVQGMLLGYLFYISKSVWLPVIAHFANNMAGVILFYYFHFNHPEVNPLEATFISKDNYLIVAISLIATTFLIYKITVSSNKLKQEA